MLERTGPNTAKPVTICGYPECEKCDRYHGSYCTVPMVISKQLYLFLTDRLQSLESKVAVIDALVTDVVIGRREDDRQDRNC